MSKAKPGCVITGVAGFVGSHLAEVLLTNGLEVIGVDNYFSGHAENMASFFNHPDFHFYELSVTEPSLLASLQKRHPSLRYCFHLAAIVSVPYSIEHPETTMEVNYQSTEALVEEAAAMNYASFVFAGSAAEYGNDQRLPLKEAYASSHTQHLSPYGSAKFLASRFVAAKPFGVALRCFNIYGPRQDPASPYSGVISRFIDLALAGEPLTIFGDGLQTRDFVFVADVVQAYLHAAGLSGLISPPFNGIYNVGTGRTGSILELAETILKLTGSRSSFMFLPERTGDIRHSLADIERFQAASGWAPQVVLGEGLARTIRLVGRR
jgi:UDP-glucose 4-epimerase